MKRRSSWIAQDDGVLMCEAEELLKRPRQWRFWNHLICEEELLNRGVLMCEVEELLNRPRRWCPRNRPRRRCPKWWWFWNHLMCKVEELLNRPRRWWFRNHLMCKEEYETIMFSESPDVWRGVIGLSYIGCRGC